MQPATILKEIENILTFVSYQKNEEISDPFYYRHGRHKNRDATVRKFLLNLYYIMKDVYIDNKNGDYEHSLKLNIDDVEDGIFLEIKRNHQRYYIINGNCPIKGVHIDYDEKYVHEDVTHFGVRILEPQT